MKKKKNEVAFKKDNVLFETKSKEETLDYFNSNIEMGLNDHEVKTRRDEYGENKLAEKKKKTILRVFLEQLNDPMIYILIAAAVISFVVSFIDTSVPGQIGWSTAHIDYIEPIVILVVVLLNGTIGTFQEHKAEKSLEALKKMTAPTSVVRRNGSIITIPASELVPGDIVILEEGSQVPADIRLLKSVNMKVDESSLTGESLPVEKNADVTFSEETPLGDKANLVFMSTPVVYGHGEGVVVQTGMNTEIGRIANMLQNAGDDTTPLQKKLGVLSKLLGIIAIILVILFFVIAVIQAVAQDKDLLSTIISMFVTAISLAVAAVPEGLPAVVTIVLATGVTRMSKVNVNVKKLHSVETLGAVTVVCSDKTGTLTQNKMTVVQAFVDFKHYNQDQFLSSNDESLINLAKGMSLCSNASIEKDKSYGDPTEIALVEMSNLFGNNKKILEEITPRINELPFDSVRKMMSVQNSLEDGRVINYTKGALDQILKYTDRIYDNGEIRKITQQDIDKIFAENKSMSSQALRVLALAISYSEQLEEKNLIFYGLVGMVDPPRKEAGHAVNEFKRAGIITVMITGDHKDTAFAIAKQLGIADSAEQCLSGSEIDELSEEQLQEKAKTCRVFARVSPENKVSIVKAFKANGNICAMTGDGVNDAPSLKTADIGIAMGITGTDVAKGAADMVLNDDNFASIEKAVEEGRGIYANIKKTVLFLLSSNIGEVLCMLIAVCMGLPTPLAAIHILFVNLITDSIPAIALGSDPKDPNIMSEKPRDPKEGLFARGGVFTLIFYGIVIGLITLAAFLYHPIIEVGGFDLNAIIKVLNENEYLLLQSETCAFIVLGLSQLFHMLGMSNTEKSFVHVFKDKNWLFALSFVIGFGLTVLMTEVDAIANVFGCTTIDWEHWLALTAISAIPLVLHEIVVLIKYFFNKNKELKFYNWFVLSLVIILIVIIALIITALVISI